MDIVDWLRKEASEIAEAHKDALHGPGGGKADAKPEDYREFEAANEIERLRSEVERLTKERDELCHQVMQLRVQNGDAY